MSHDTQIKRTHQHFKRRGRMRAKHRQRGIAATLVTEAQKGLQTRVTTKDSKCRILQSIAKDLQHFEISGSC